jgi:hypothetical protein
VPLYPPQTPHATQMRTQATTVGSQRLTAWATARPIFYLTCDIKSKRKGMVNFNIWPFLRKDAFGFYLIVYFIYRCKLIIIIWIPSGIWWKGHGDFSADIQKLVTCTNWSFQLIFLSKIFALGTFMFTGMFWASVVSCF